MIISATQMGREALEGCIFSPPSLLPVPGRGKETDSAASRNGSFPIPVYGQFLLVPTWTIYQEPSVLSQSSSQKDVSCVWLTETLSEWEAVGSAEKVLQCISFHGDVSREMMLNVDHKKGFFLGWRMPYMTSAIFLDFLTPSSPLSLSQISWFCSFCLLFGDPTHCTVDVIHGSPLA